VSFQEKLARGRLGERLVSAWCKGRGWYVVPSYEFSGKADDKAPRMSGSDRAFVIPDLDTARTGRRRWLEVKTYDHAAPNRALGEPVHGIKRNHHQQYLSVQDISGCDVYLGVLEVSTGELLIAKLSDLVAHPCMCRPCRDGNASCCHAPIQDSVYFRRSQFIVAHKFTESELSELRARAA
jgi:hypothetical protein